MKQNCLTCGQFVDRNHRNHRCPVGVKSKAPLYLRTNIGNQNKVQEPTILFASKDTLIALLPDGSLIKNKINADGTKTITEVNLFTKIFYANKVAKAKNSYSLNRDNVGNKKNKDKVSKALEAYARTEEIYTKKNELINDIASRISDCKKNIIETDKECDKIMAEAISGLKEDMTPYIEAVVKASMKHENTEGNFHATTLPSDFAQLETAALSAAMEKGQAAVKNLTLRHDNLREIPRQALVALEEQLAKAFEPDVKAD